MYSKAGMVLYLQLSLGKRQNFESILFFIPLRKAKDSLIFKVYDFIGGV
jgi:hypothetical protein